MLASQSLDAGGDVAGAREAGDRIDADQQLLRTFLDGNPDAFDRLFLKYQDYVYNICLGILGNADDARDCAQETFLRVYHKAAEFRGKSALSTWIYRIAVNVCVGQIRKRRTPAGPGNCASLDDERVREIADPGPAPWTGMLREEEEARVRACIAGLHADYRIVLVLRYFQDLSYDEITRVLGWSLPTVKVKLHRARRAFAARYTR
jgi:RNA polymerase sigma-70 factor (ECF subfamily)